MNHHELIASDAYWENPVQLPRLAFGAMLRDDWMDGSSPQLRQQVTDLYSTVLDGYVSETVAEGDPLPIFNEAETSLLKVVMDIRTVAPRWHLLQKLGKLDEATFNERARNMISDRLYAGSSASLIEHVDSTGETVIVSRYVSYLKASYGGKQLSGIYSYNLFRSAVQTPYNIIERPLVVGQAYELNRRGTKLGKVALATIFRPTPDGRGTPMQQELVMQRSAEFALSA